MAESEMGVLGRQCLARRISDCDTIEREVAAWATCRNKNNAKANVTSPPPTPV